MGILLVRVGNGSEQLVLEGASKAEDLWSSEFIEGEITEQLETLGVQVLAADHTQVVDGAVVNIHPLATSGRAQRILAVTYFMEGEPQVLQVLH